ncbi:MAG: thermostable hemolysin [Xanthomonadales bacterium]|nr:thermostable hemolysin [Xanthomonadales bacterium]
MSYPNRKSLAPSISNDGLEAKALLQLTRILKPAPVFAAHAQSSPERTHAEQYIAARFHAAHGADIRDFMPVLLTMRCHGRTTAATGIRAAAQQPLFLEQYLPGPIEQVLGDMTGETIQRTNIAEIGNLAATQSGSSYLLFIVLSAILEQARFDWVVFTATPRVRKMLGRLGLRVHVLCAADPACLTRSAAAEWGRYYASGPQVLAGRVGDAMDVLSQRRPYASLLSLFRGPIGEMAKTVRRDSSRNGSHVLAA